MAREKSAQTQKEAAQIAKSLEQLTATTQQIAHCLAVLTIRFSDYRRKPKSECIPFLRDLGFDRNAIAAILGSTPDSVSVQLSKLKASKKGKPSDSAEEQGDAAN
jgi:CRP-like cAMP-binding protein